MTGRVVVGYRFAGAGTAGIAVASSDDGRRWERQELLSTFGFGGGLVTVCTAREHVYVAYFDPLRGIISRASHDGGVTFPDDVERTVSAAGENVAMEAPSCVADGEDLVVAYGIGARSIDTASSAPLSQVALARSRDAGKTFDARAAISEPSRVLLHPRMIAVDDGAIGIVAYAAPTPAAGHGEVRFFRSAFGQATSNAVLRANVRIAPRRDDPAWSGDYLGYAIQGGRLLTVFEDVPTTTPQAVFLAVATPP